MMGYYLDLFKFSGVTSSLNFKYILGALAKGKAEKFMDDFDIDSVHDELRAVFENDKHPSGSIGVIQKKRSAEPAGMWITVVTSYSRAQEVITRMFPILLKHDLILLDRQNAGKTWVASDILNREKITVKARASEVIQRLSAAQLRIFTIRRIEQGLRHITEQVSYVLTLRYDPNRTLLERSEVIYNCLNDLLLPGEILVCKDRSFNISGSRYQITICVEACKKSANRICFYDDNKPQTTLLHRMGCDMAFRMLSDELLDEVFDRMNFFEMTDAYPNPADRFIKSVNITKSLLKSLRKGELYMSYSSIGPYGSDFIFHLSCDATFDSGTPFLNDGSVSCLIIEESTASFILPMINDCYPYVGERYYLDDNPLPFQMWRDIIARIEYVSELILNDTFNPELEPYIRSFELYVLGDEDLSRCYGSDGEREKMDSRASFLFKHRKKVVRFQRAFVAWLKCQMLYEGLFDMINFSGP